MTNKWVVRMVAMVLVVVTAFGALSTASAQGPDGQPPAQGEGFGPGQRGPGERVIGLLVQMAADAAGMTPQELVEAAREAESLGEALTAAGVDPQTVIDATMAEVNTRIDEALADGKITEEQAATAKAELAERLDTAMYSELPLRPTPVQDRVQDIVERSLVGVLAEMAGVDAKDLIREAGSDTTLADIAASYGVDGSAVIAETAARITEEVNQRVADGTLSEGQAANILDGLQERLEERFNSPLPLGEGWGERGGGRPGGRPGGPGFGA